MIITVLTYLLPCTTACTPRVHDVEELLEVWHGLQQSAVDSEIFAPAYGAKEDILILSSDNMLIERMAIEAVKQSEMRGYHFLISVSYPYP